ncbi:MAG: hypothetical protein OXQ32_08585 [bacterium]|nr:hypothetical protein [bacterium]
MTEWILADLSRDDKGKVSVNQVRGLTNREFETLVAAEQCLQRTLHRNIRCAPSQLPGVLRA